MTWTLSGSSDQNRKPSYVGILSYIMKSSDPVMNQEPINTHIGSVSMEICGYMNASYIYLSGYIFISRDPQLFIWKVCRVLWGPCPRIFIQVTLDARDFPFTFEVEIGLRCSQGGPPTWEIP